jgi:hypothetical protein
VAAAVQALDALFGQCQRHQRADGVVGGRVFQHAVVVVQQDGPGDVRRQAPVARQQAADGRMVGAVALVFER